MRHMCQECPGYKALWKVTRKALRAVGVHVRSQEVPGELVYGGPAYATASPAAAVRGSALHAWRVARSMANLPEGARGQTTAGLRRSMRNELARLVALDFRASTRQLLDRTRGEAKDTGRPRTVEGFEAKWGGAVRVYRTDSNAVVYEMTEELCWVDG